MMKTTAKVSTMLDKSLVDAFLAHKMEKAETARNDAAYGGRWDDGGYASTKEKIEIFRAGFNGYWPFVWSNEVDLFEQEMKNAADPEYQEYLRLQKKFEK
jgi:hypothetical protein